MIEYSRSVIIWRCSIAEGKRMGFEATGFPTRYESHNVGYQTTYKPPTPQLCATYITLDPPSPHHPFSLNQKLRSLFHLYFKTWYLYWNLYFRTWKFRNITKYELELWISKGRIMREGQLPVTIMATKENQLLN